MRDGTGTCRTGCAMRSITLTAYRTGIAVVFGSIISCRWNSEERTRSQTFAYRLAPTLTAKTSTKTDLHDEVCAGSIPLDAARAEMLRLWSAREPVGKR